MRTTGQHQAFLQRKTRKKKKGKKNKGIETPVEQIVEEKPAEVEVIPQAEEKTQEVETQDEVIAKVPEAALEVLQEQLPLTDAPKDIEITQENATEIVEEPTPATETAQLDVQPESLEPTIEQPLQTLDQTAEPPVEDENLVVSSSKKDKKKKKKGKKVSR